MLGSTKGKLDEVDMKVNGLDLEFICNLKRELVNAAPMKSVQSLSVKETGELWLEPASIRAGWLDWFFQLTPNLNKFTISADLIHLINPSTVAAIFAKVEIFRVANQSTETELKKLQLLKFPKIRTFILFLAAGYGEFTRRSLKKFAKVNPSLQKVQLSIDGRSLQLFSASRLPRELN